MTGASGTVSKLVRRRAVDGVDLAVEIDVDLAVEGGDEVGQLVRGGAQVDRAFEGLFEQRGFGLGEADHRGRRDRCWRRTGPGCRGVRCGRCRAARRGAG